MRDEEARACRRIVITFDCGEPDTAELEMLTLLARRTGAELEGVFVEDSDVLRLAELHFLQELRPTSFTAERVHSRRMEQEYRAKARRAQRALSDYAAASGVPWRFRVWRGSVERELLDVVKADVLALTRLGAALTPRSRRRPYSSLSVLFDGKEASARAMTTATGLLSGNESAVLQILLQVSEPAVAGALREQAAAIIHTYAGQVSFRTLAQASLAELTASLRGAGSEVLVLAQDNSILRGRSLRDCLAHLHCPLLLVR